MAALNNEIAFYARSKIKMGSSILLIQSQEDCTSMELSDYKTSLCGVKDLPNLISGNCSFDAAIVLHQLRDIKEAKCVDNFLSNLISIVKKDGYLMICENTEPPNSSLRQYTEKFEYPCQTMDGKNYGLRLIWATCLRHSIDCNLNWNNYCWLLQKCELSDHVEDRSHRHDMDSYSYSDFIVKSYEWVFGEGCLTHGGKIFMAEVLSQLKLQPLERLLDVACGTGGATMYAAKEYGVNVVGLDISSNVLNTACNRACSGKDSRVTFMMADVTKHNFPHASFDAIYCRDAMLYMGNKADLLKKYFVWLKPGGRLIFTDYLVPDVTISIELEQYAQCEKYKMGTFVEYVKAINEAGFKKVNAKKISDKLKHFFEDDLHQIRTTKDEYVKAFSTEEFNYLVEEWLKEFYFVKSGQIEYGLFNACKD